MTRSMLRVGILVGSLAAFSLATGVAAKPGHGRRGPNRLADKISEMGLPAETETAALAVIENARPAHRARHGQMRDAKDDLRALLEAEPLDESAVMEQIDVVGALGTAARKARIGTWLEVRALLAPEERKAFGLPGGDRDKRHHRRGRHGRQDMEL